MARSQSAGVNAYLNNLNPFADWSWGAYFHEVGQFGIGEGKGFVNFAAGAVVYSSPELLLLDAQTGGHLSSPLASVGESQSNGAGTAEAVATVASFLTGEGEAAAVEGGAAKTLAGAESRAASGFTRSNEMQRGFAMIPGKSRQLKLFPDEPYKRRTHYGDTPTDAQAASVPPGMEFDHDPMLVDHYYNGDGKGGLQGFNMTNEERRAFATDVSHGRAATPHQQRVQGAAGAALSKRMKKLWWIKVGGRK